MTPLKNRSKVSVFALAAAAAVTLSGCDLNVNMDDPRAAENGAETSTGPSPATKSKTEVSSPTKGGDAAGSESDIPACWARDMRVEMIDQGHLAPAGISSWMLVATNTGGETCLMNGYPTIELQNAANEELTGGRSVHQDHPGPPVKFVMKKNSSAFAGVKWQMCPDGDLVGGFRMVPPRQSEGTSVTTSTERSEAEMQKVFRPCERTVTVGSFQPSSQGVVFTS